MGVINLSECSNDVVKILPRDLCARRNTIELSVVISDGDEQAKSKTVKLYRLSADTKEQMNDWMIHINWAIKNLKIWNPPKSS